MSSHFSRLKEELVARQHELQEQQGTVESIKRLTRELEAQKKALVEKSAELDDRQKEVRTMQSRLDVLTGLEPAINAAMHGKSSTEDVVKHVVENAIRSDHLTGSQIVQLTLDIAMQLNGRTRNDNLDDFLIDLINNEGSLKAAIESGMANFATVNFVVRSALTTAMSRGSNAADLKKIVAETLDTLLSETVILFDKKTKAAAKENTPPSHDSHTTPVTKNGLRGQAKDFQPRNTTQDNNNNGGWDAFARAHGWGSEGVSGWGNGNGNGWN